MNHPEFSQYLLQPLDATLAAKDGMCDGLQGRLRRNIVNRNLNGKGLQLEFSRELREGLVDTDAEYEVLREVVYGAIASSMY